ncbi:anti-sigma factor [Nonlabens xiamenensis]|uniref:anti-sigma factor n=1 Tax=Nonlabens xiamenensis TaxID=2341043 RepID=UPI000F614CDB|nr:anti-sigma factor [Nonlabens xiamenensis]
MDTQELINSGELELYVCGVLDLERSIEITQEIKDSVEVQLEVEKIETTYIKLAQGLAPSKDEQAIYDRLMANIQTGGNNRTKEGSSWTGYLGWAAAIAFLLGCAYLYNNNAELNNANSQLENEVTNIQQEKEFLDAEMENIKVSNEDYQEALTFIKDRNTVRVDLAGQPGFDNTFATAFHNPVEDVTYIDMTGLPPAPDGKDYQLWSLTLNPLTPTSLGVVKNDTDLLRIENPYATEAFGITLEPAGGSPGPNLEQLYTLGVIN